MNDETKQPSGVQVTSLLADFSDGRTGAKAWKIDVEMARQRNPENKSMQALVAGYIIDAQWVDRHDRYFAVVITDLSKPGKDGGPAPIRVPGANYEIYCMELAHGVVPVVDDDMLIEDMAFVGQFPARDGPDAIFTLRAVVEDILSGHLLPTQDGVPQWIVRFGDACVEQETHVSMHTHEGMIPVTSDSPLARALDKLLSGKRSLRTGDGKLNVPDDATVTPGCDCEVCTVIREARKEQGRPVITHGGEVEAAEDTPLVH